MVKDKKTLKRGLYNTYNRKHDTFKNLSPIR